MSIDQVTGSAHVLVRFAESVLGAFGRVAATPAWSMTADDQRQALVQLDRLTSAMAELRLRVLAAADKDEAGAASGASSTAAWLACTTLRDRSDAARDVRLAAALDTDFEVTRAVLAAGELNVDHARVIVAAVGDLPDDVPAEWRDMAQAHLVAEARRVDPKTLRILGRRIFEVLDPQTADEREGKKLEEEEARARARVRLTLRDNGDGTHSGSFTIPDLHAAMLTKALTGLAAPRRVGEARVDPATGRKRPYPQLLGEAFCELLENYPADKLPEAGGTSASVVVTIPLDFLLRGLGAALLDDGTRISACEARRLACNAKVIPVVLGGDSMPLDVGRSRRLYDAYQRQSMAVRDRGCTAAGCDRPPSWTEAHHDHPWSHGGATDISNGRLLCAFHHRLAHNDSYSKTRLPDGSLRFARRM